MKHLFSTALALAFVSSNACADPKVEVTNPKHVEMQKKIDQKIKADPKFQIKPGEPAKKPETPAPAPNAPVIPK